MRTKVKIARFASQNQRAGSKKKKTWKRNASFQYDGAEKDVDNVVGGMHGEYGEREWEMIDNA